MVSIWTKIKKTAILWLGAELPNHIITDEERLKSLEIRQLHASVKNLEKQVALKERIEGARIALGGSSSSEDKIIDFISQLVISSQQQKQPGEQQTQLIEQKTAPGAEIELTDEQITTLIKQNPNLLSKSKLFSDEQIEGYIKKFIPNISQSSLKRLFKQIRQ